MRQEVKDLLKPPFSITTYFGGAKYVDITIKMPEIYRHLRNALQEWITAALNEKAEREWGELLKWIRVWRDAECLLEGSYLKCPKCSGVTWDEDDINYCPHCGQKLAEPENKE